MREAGQVQAAEIARKAIDLLIGLAEQAGVDDATLRHQLRLSRSDWQQWLGVLRNGPLPSNPSVPQLLRHLGALSSRLDREARLACA